MLLKLPIVLLGNAPKISLLCSELSQYALNMKAQFTVECSIREFNYINECSIGVF